MNILVVGQGGREHAIAWKLQQSEKVTEVTNDILPDQKIDIVHPLILLTHHQKLAMRD